MKAIQKINKFYIVVAALLVAFAALIGFAMNTILKSINQAGKIDTAPQEAVLIDKPKLNRVYDRLVNEKTVPLDAVQ